MGIEGFIGILNLVGLFTIKVCSDVRKSVTLRRRSARNNFPDALWASDRGIDVNAMTDPPFKLGADALYRIHNTISKVAVVESQTKFINMAAIISLVVVILSLVAGFYLSSSAIGEQESIKTLSDWLLIYVPVILLIGQVCMIIRAFALDSFLSSIEDDAIGDVTGKGSE